VDLAQKQPNKKHHHAQHEHNTDDAHQSIIGREQVLKQFHVISLKPVHLEPLCPFAY
jgi:hypothetical protein